jgi:hypothetical protein
MFSAAASNYNNNNNNSSIPSMFASASNTPIRKQRPVSIKYIDGHDDDVSVFSVTSAASVVSEPPPTIGNSSPMTKNSYSLISPAGGSRPSHIPPRPPPPLQTPKSLGSHIRRPLRLQAINEDNVSLPPAFRFSATSRKAARSAAGVGGAHSPDGKYLKKED